MQRLFRIWLQLARTDGFPEGSAKHGYVFVAPLDNAGYIDAAAWQTLKDKCRVTRFWGNEPVEHGFLRHVGHGWRFDYDARSNDDDEPFFKLDRHALQPGGYVSITEHDGIQYPLCVMNVEPIRDMEQVS